MGLQHCQSQSYQPMDTYGIRDTSDLDLRNPDLVRNPFYPALSFPADPFSVCLFLIMSLQVEVTLFSAFFDLWIITSWLMPGSWIQCDVLHSDPLAI